jgi:hypothetical protein
VSSACAGSSLALLYAGLFFAAVIFRLSLDTDSLASRFRITWVNILCGSDLNGIFDIPRTMSVTLLSLQSRKSASGCARIRGICLLSQLLNLIGTICETILIRLVSDDFIQAINNIRQLFGSCAADFLSYAFSGESPDLTNFLPTNALAVSLISAHASEGTLRAVVDC